MNRLVGFGKDVLNGWLNAEAFTLAAALAYYAIFAIAPLLLISISRRRRCSSIEPRPYRN